MSSNQGEKYHPIPRITNGLVGPAWRQPDRNLITVTDTHAVMKKEVFESLAEYSRSYPSGVYPGKMWRRMEPDSRLLCWYDLTSDDPTRCTVHFRPVIYQEMVDLVLPNKKPMFSQQMFYKLLMANAKTP
jgi:hypothetical protein